MSATTTPRTEKAIEFAMAFFARDNPQRFEHVCRFARQLERELTAKAAELEKYQTGYAALVEAVKRMSVFKDVDVDWNEFPAICLSMCHQENNELKDKLKQTRAAALEEAADHCLKTCDYSQSGVEFTRTRRLLAEQLRAKAASVREGKG